MAAELTLQALEDGTAAIGDGVGCIGADSLLIPRLVTEVKIRRARVQRTEGVKLGRLTCPANTAAARLVDGGTVCLRRENTSEGHQ